MSIIVLVLLALLSPSKSLSNDDQICTTADCAANRNSKIIEITEDCKDEHEGCEGWAGKNECENNSSFMLKSCKLSCGICMPLNLGEVQIFEGFKSLTVYRQSIEYLEKEVMVKPEYAKIRRHCTNTHADCTLWAALGECQSNPKYMHKGCPLACRKCLDLDIGTRCPVDSSTDAIKSGDLTKMFQKITSEGSEYAKYKPKILSQPQNENDDPWIVEFESFLSNEECDKLIEYGELLTFERSGNVGKANADGSYESSIDDSRTSENTWCENDCYDDPMVKDIVNRIADVTGIPEPNQEYLQLLKYEPNQYYKMHHDFIPFHVDRQPGPRVLTLLLYLNELEGGGTQFANCDGCDIRTIASPKKGKALLWHNVLLDDPNKMDEHTHHEALPVIEGIKYAANAWIHLRDFKSAMKTECI